LKISVPAWIDTGGLSRLLAEGLKSSLTLHPLDSGFAFEKKEYMTKVEVEISFNPKTQPESHQPLAKIMAGKSKSRSSD